jgi:iron complex outermembrane receptor protein
VLLACTGIYAQHTIRLSIKNSEEKEPLAGATATISTLNKTTVADSLGIATFADIAPGTYTVTVSFVGLEEKQVSVTVPMATEEPLEVLLEEGEEHEAEEVVVTATRISRTIANIPTRVEVISGEELAEKANMKPGDIRMLLSESTGIQTQQTSATSFNAGIRIQGLEGRYTQILRDGYPLYSGFSGGLSILQIVPLDLRQVEVIKGAASTLYGGGAIAGLVNLVSKTPGRNRELSFLANGTSAGGLDLSGFYSQRYGKAGLTLFASRNSNRPFDPADIGLTAIPKFERYTINPRLFLYGKNTTADFGITYITEDRTGGSVNYIKNGGNGFFEKNNTDRITTQFGIAHKLSEHSTLQFKNSYSRFDRVITIPTYTFDALQQSSFSELTLNRKGEKADWIFGANVLTDYLAEQVQTADPKRDYHYNTYGVFVQNAWLVSDKVVLETGLRGDYVNEYGFELLPRVSAMFRVTPKLTTRIGGGFGYKTPTIFTEEAERIQFQNLLPIDINRSKNERSIGGNWDINYRTNIGDVGFSFNHLFFYTRLNNPLVLMGAAGGKVQFQNSTGHLDTKGMETNLRFTYDDLKLFIGYTYTDANTHFTNTKEWLPLTARHRLNNVLMYEVEDKWKLGLEAYYFSKQQLNDGTFGKPYWVTGFMAEKIWEKISLYVNFENFTNTRQTKFDTIFTGTINNPTFRDIYAPVEGFVVNGGIKIRL